ncbi:hypothetical protein [Stutzerimonas stutzeri]|uniref:Uncharacterized protein n=1 Tax=Stutzerimonas stutzeri TaxID=316 RepID=A0AA42P9R5_STUST|nr:hypothetical protein [Stutzerimonas stutzeri]MDH1236498.1 hypothetical protein [Stutzerimonas stutzeri]
MAYQVPQKTAINRFGIDVETHCASVLVHRLGGLKSTYSIHHAGAYREDRGYSQVWVDTRWTEQELEAWLDKSKGIDYVGVWVREENQTIAA